MGNWIMIIEFLWRTGNDYEKMFIYWLTREIINLLLIYEKLFFKTDYYAPFFHNQW